MEDQPILYLCTLLIFCSFTILSPTFDHLILDFDPEFFTQNKVLLLESVESTVKG